MEAGSRWLREVHESRVTHADLADADASRAWLAVLDAADAGDEQAQARIRRELHDVIVHDDGSAWWYMPLNIDGEVGRYRPTGYPDDPEPVEGETATSYSERLAEWRLQHHRPVDR
jgi:hypothetical protein